MSEKPPLPPTSGEQFPTTGNAGSSFDPQGAMKAFDDEYFGTAEALRAQGIQPADIPREWGVVWGKREEMRDSLSAYARTSDAKQADIAKRMSGLLEEMRAAKEKVLSEAPKQKSALETGESTSPARDAAPKTVLPTQGEIPPDADPDFSLLSDEARARADALREQLLPTHPGTTTDSAPRAAATFATDSLPQEKQGNSESPTEKIRELRERLTALEVHVRSGGGMKGDNASIEKEILGLEDEIRIAERASVPESGTPAESRQKLRNLLGEFEKVQQSGPRSMESDYSDSSFESEVPSIAVPAVLKSPIEVGTEKGNVPAVIQRGSEVVLAPNQQPKMSEAWRDSLRAHLDGRSAALNERAKSLGPAAEKLVRSIGERYNRLGLKKKLLIGGGLSAAALGLSVATGGASIWWTFGILSVYRAAGGAGTFVTAEGLLKNAHEKKERWWNKYPKAYAATAGLLVGSGLLGKAIGAGLHVAGGTSEGEAVQRVFEKMWHSGKVDLGITGKTVEHVSHAAAPHYGGEATTGPTAHPHGFSGEATSGPELHTQFPQVPTVLAQTGLGYEAMAKQLTEQMHSMHLDPSQFPPGSDAARLLAAPPHDINRIVQQIATERGYLKLGSGSVLVRPGDTLTVGPGGSLHFFDPKMAMHAPYVVNAPNAAPTTPLSSHVEMSQLVNHAPTHEAVTPPRPAQPLPMPPPRPPVPGAERAFPLPPKPPPMPPAERLPIPPAPPPHEAAMHTPLPASAPHAPTTPGVGQERITTDQLNDWSLSRARLGLDTPPITPPSPHEIAAAVAQHAGGTAGAERAVPLPTPIEHARAFVNAHGLTIDPTHGEVFQMVDGKVAAYGNSFDARFNAAQDYAFKHPGTAVWVQSEQPYLTPDSVTGKMVAKPWVFKLQVNPVTHTLDPVSSAQPLSNAQIGSLQPETFTQELH